MKNKKSNFEKWKKYFFVFVFLFLVSLIFAAIFLFTLKKITEPEFCDNITKNYPEHPNITECACTEKRDFCIGDVAEINNDINLCYQITDPDIKNFCIARISLDRNLCSRLLDEGLRGACLESIELKINWSKGL